VIASPTAIVVFFIIISSLAGCNYNTLLLGEAGEASPSHGDGGAMKLDPSVRFADTPS
jgi:hypothetical protein